ncbi:MAG: hypothetical protein HC933_15260 [Pleurocapsa sp. SU_196_0]|nr:hypothetical protein [Pleurocapsa sp. SU_196_0]
MAGRPDRPARDMDARALERNVNLRVEGRSSSSGVNQVRTEYTVAYTDLGVLLGLNASGAAPGEYSLSGRLEYRNALVRSIRWNVSVVSK